MWDVQIMDVRESCAGEKDVGSKEKDLRLQLRTGLCSMCGIMFETQQDLEVLN